MLVCGSSAGAESSRRRFWVAGAVALLGLTCLVFRASDAGASEEAGNSLAVQSLATSGFKVIAGWESQHHSYARELS